MAARLFFLVFFLSRLLVGQEIASSESESRNPLLKVGVVDVQRLFRNYRKTLAAEREIDLARAEIEKKSQLATNLILEKNRLVEERLLQLRSGTISDIAIAEIRRELPILNRELKMAERANQTERDQANEHLNRQMIGRMTSILEEIVQLTAQKAEVEGFDLVFDTSGRNSNQVLPVLYSKAAVDLTEMMAEELNKPSSENR